MLANLFEHFLDENNLNKEIMEKLKLTIDFYKEKDERMTHEQNVNSL